MSDIRCLTDYPLLDDVDFIIDNEQEEIDNTKEDEDSYKGDYMNMSPNELGLIFVSTRNDNDFTKLYNVIKNTLYKNIIKVVGSNKDDVETVIDTTMLYVYFNIEKFDINKSTFCTWVHMIAKSAALNHINRFKKNNNVCSIDFSDLYDSSVMVDDADQYTDSCTSPYICEDDGFVDIVYDKGKYKVYDIENVIVEFFDVVTSCIDDLPKIKRNTLIHRLINNKTIKETSNLTGASCTSVKRYYSDGKKRIIDCIKNEHSALYEMMKDMY